ncbi:unnamed protein product [Microthlaspi erraticum]|uniref:Uncharacterized protein n=1 Tax=Microthlaspi erraticum TaxID=1685480 RepID=A0A6D2KS97_9BRAS|nr:unnamed protein product [Microthlaspi erraticum]
MLSSTKSHFPALNLPNLCWRMKNLVSTGRTNRQRLTKITPPLRLLSLSQDLQRELSNRHHHNNITKSTTTVAIGDAYLSWALHHGFSFSTTTNTTSAIKNQIPFTLLFNKRPTYDHLRVFGCLCFPSLNHSNLHKLSPRTTPCLFLGYPSQHRGYRCLDLKTNKIIISRHVHFDEEKFPAAVQTKNKNAAYQFLDPIEEASPLFQSILQTPIASQTQPPPAPAQTLPPPTQPPPAPTRHTMTTRSKAGIRKPKTVISLLTKTKSPLPKNHIHALSDPNWTPSMTDEYDAMIKTKSWSLVPRPPNVNIVSSIWLYTHKHDADGALTRHKSRLVANGKSQEAGVDFKETFSPVVKPATIRTVLNIGVARNWPIHQLDVQNAFLHGELEETVYMHQPPGFVDKRFPHHVCKLQRPIYGLKQSPRAWNARFSKFINQLGFVTSKADVSLFVYRKDSELAYILLYVDDILLTASSTSLMQQIISSLKSEFPMKDLGKIHHFLGIKVEYNSKGLLLSQTTYAKEILNRAGMSDCKPCATPIKRCLVS